MKLVYFSYAWYLYFTQKDLFDEPIQAWTHGPVIPSIYHEFKHFGLYGKIENQFATYIDLLQDSDKSETPFIKNEELQQNQDLERSLAGVWYLYKDCAGKELEKITHEEDTPWKNNYKEKQNIEINATESDKRLIRQRAEKGFNKAQEKLLKEQQKETK
jgi:uncharacterized phage-associated protein